MRGEFEECSNLSSKLDNFLKKVEFTFQADRKKTSTSKILMKAKKNLFEEEKEAKQRLKKLMQSA